MTAISSAPLETPAIHATGLAKSYGSTVALAGLSLTVSQGEVFGFLGPNGAGKTTGVKLLLGLTRPTTGEAWLLGIPIREAGARLSVGYLPELFRYQPWLTAREVLALHCNLARVERADWPGEIAAALRAAGLASRGDDRVGGFSKGMQQRLGLGVALLGHPRLVILDEPTSALDPVGRLDVRNLIHGLRDTGTTVFLNSHLLTEVEHVCDRVAIVDRGRVIASGTLDDMLEGSGVRVRVSGLDDTAVGELSRFGRVTAADGWLDVALQDQETVPLLVADIVERGGRIYAVEPRHLTLEERFVQVVERSDQSEQSEQQP